MVDKHLRQNDSPVGTAVEKLNLSPEDAPTPDWLGAPDSFAARHIGPRTQDWAPMVERCGFRTLDEMIDAVVPSAIRLERPLRLPAPVTEGEALAELRSIASRNQVFRSFIGLGFHDCITPPVILRNVIENPGWYTQYTPYQAEIAQGRLEVLLLFQTLICDLTGLAIANASMLDEASAAAEAMTLCFGLKGSASRNVFLVSRNCHPQTIEVVQTRAWPHGIEVLVCDDQSVAFSSEVFGALLQYPASDGVAHDYSDWIAQAHAAGALVAVAADLLSLVLLRPPGEFGADIALGNTQRFGVPLGFGGPHAAYLATREEFKRHLPGRLVGVSKDAQGQPALRLSLQTREQHIRREKATSNICTAQVLLAIVATLYAVYHGPDGLRRIARRIHGLAKTLATGLEKLGCQMGSAPFFDTLRVSLPRAEASEILERARVCQINLRLIDERTLGIALDETTTPAEVETLWQIFNSGQPAAFTVIELAAGVDLSFPPGLARTSDFLRHPTFGRYHSETEMLRYLRRLESRDLSLTTSMIPLGSCTMKLNAAVEMMPITWPEFSRMHPFAPPSQTEGYRVLFAQLEQWLAEITGFSGVSLQPNAGSQGEYTGLLVIRQYHASRGDHQRRVCLIPTSAHGTNPASAVMAGFQVIPVACDKDGNVDLADLRAKAETHRQALAALMVTYPSTHGVFETGIKEICRVVHEHGGQVYMDGANMNAQVGLCRPGDIGADVCHLNLHKTFSIPHGGGGPGVGPICVAPHLKPFLPGHSVVPQPERRILGAVTAAPWGSAGILPIAWTYIRLLGPRGLAMATKAAILNANYIAHRMQSCFPVLYRGAANLVAHECILDLRPFEKTTVEDVAKRLMDYGFHAPTISWPVAGTMMVEPTESESKAELDRFCDALMAIHAEMLAVESGQMDARNNPLKNAPHTASTLTVERWERPYSREKAVFPAPWLREHKFWPAVSRIDNVYGDRNPVCTCV